MRLMLENFIHWNKIYLTEDKKNPLVLYSVMLTNLQSRVKFPDDLLYLGKEHNITNDFHIKPASSLVPIQNTLTKSNSPTKTGSPAKKPDSVSDSERTEIHKQILLTVPSGNDYKNHSPKIFQYAKRNSRSVNAVLLAEIYEILLSKTYPSTFKFYALLLLVKITETMDELFATQLAEDKELLTKLANDAKVDKDKPRYERGRTLYPGSAQDSVVGSNYHTLVIECLQFWAESYLPSAKNETFVKFNTVYGSLIGNDGVEFPQGYNFVMKSLKFEEDEAGKSLSKRDLYPQAQVKKSVDEALAHIKPAITSGNDYQRNSGKIFSAIAKNSKEYTKAYLNATTSILKARDTPPVSQFYATYLLLKLTETKNDTLINELAYSQDLLDDLSQKAQFDRTKEHVDKGKTFFVQNPRDDESRLGHNYVVLLLETFTYWRQTFNPANKKDPTVVFNTIYTNLEKKTKLPDHFHYAGKNHVTDDAHFPRRFELTSFDEPLSSSAAKPKVETKPPLGPSVSGGAVSEDASVKKMKEGLARYENNKGSLREFLENNQQEDRDMRDIMVYLSKEVSNSYKTDVMPNIEPLLSSKDPQAEKYVTQAFEEGAASETVERELASFEKNKQGYNDYRKKVLPVLQSTQKDSISGSSPLRGSTPTGIEPVEQKKHSAYSVPKEEPVEQMKRSGFAAKEEPTRHTAFGAMPTSPEKTEPIKAEPVATFGTERSAAELQYQRYFAHELEDDVESPKNLVQPKNLKSSEVISRDYGAAGRAPAHEEYEHEAYGSGPQVGQTQMGQSQGVRAAAPQGQPDLMQRYRAGPLEDDNDGDLKQSTYRSSMRMSKAYTEENDMRNSMKMSRVKQNDLTNIESSIRNSFVNTGKKPPQFKPLTELQIREELEREIVKVKAERDHLQKENNKLNTMLRQGGGSEDDKLVIDDLKHHLNQHQQWVEALQEENAALKEEVERLRGDQHYAHHPDEARTMMESKIKHLEAELAAAKANPQPRRAEPPKQGGQRAAAGHPGHNEIEDDEDEGTERYETPLNESGAAHTNYDVDWASTTHHPKVEPSEYDVDWPAHQKDRTESEWELQKALNTKRGEEPKLIRGRIVDSNNPIFADLKKDVKGLPLSNDLHSFKVACLKPKCPLFENDLIRVGVSSTVVHDHTNHKNMLKLVLYFENKSDQLIDEFMTDFSQAKSLNRIAKPGRLETFIDSGKQVKQQVIVAFDKVPFECLQLYATVRSGDTQPETFSLFLPTLITKFMEFKYVNADVFRERWKMKSNNILRSEEITVNPGIMKTAYDFKKYFGYLIDLKPMDEYDFVQGKKSIKLGGLFELDVPNTEYLLKINVLPSHQVVFQIATFETESNTASFLLQALAFLFKKA